MNVACGLADLKVGCHSKELEREREREREQFTGVLNEWRCSSDGTKL